MNAELSGAVLFLVRVTSLYLVLALVGSMLHVGLSIYRYFKYQDDKKLLLDSIEALNNLGKRPSE